MTGLNNTQVDNIITLELSSSGQLIAKSQVVDYQHRGTELEDYSVLDFFVETYETEITKADREADLSEEDTHRGPGRPRNPRVRYLTSHPKSKSVHRVIRSPNHRNLPNFLGRWFPRNDDEAIYDFYCACMLVLLKPWRDLATDLRSSTESWAAAFETFRTSATPKAKRALSGIQYFHECESAAQRDTTGPIHYQVPPDTQILDDESGADHIPRHQEFSEEGLARLKEESVSLREELHGRMAIELARHLSIFGNEQHDWAVNHHSIPLNASQDDLARISMWHNLLQSAIDERTNTPKATLSGTENIGTATVERSTLPGDLSLDAAATVLLQPTTSEQALPAVDPDCLKPDQLRAYRIVTWHLTETLRRHDVPPLRMVLYGEGGTGKSRVIQTITEAFAARGVSHMLMKAAYTGVAASLVDGKTTHVIGSLSLGSKDNVSDAAKKKLQDFWRNIRYLIIDEYSMLSKSFLAALSRNISIGMEGSEGFQQGMSFGGLNVILCGDLHQFPPVACGKQEPLYYPSGTGDSIMLQVGRKIYEEFSTVVILREQMRVTDHSWRDFLDHLRYGRVEPRHLKMLRTLLLKRQIPNPSSSLTNSPNTNTFPDPHPETANLSINFSTQPWADASLITPRHAVRIRWNQAATQKQCTDLKTRLFVCPALDMIKGSPLTLEERYALASPPKNGRRRRDKGLLESVHLAIGMKVMVTNNLQTDLDITNGARGVVVGIILNPEEPPLEGGSVVTLKHLPECVLVKLSRTRAAALPGLEEGVIPIQRISTKTQIRIRGKSRTVTRTQFPITGAYSFTDYRAQGQTIPYVVVDIASPPTSGLSLFNLYVALSRSSGRGTIRLLRDFDDNMFLQAHVPELLEEDERLGELDVVTRGWWDKMSS